MRRVLVTGITGQDGGYLCERLLAEGAEVHGIATGVSLPDAERPWLTGATVHELNIAESAPVQDLLAQVRPDEIYNLAAISSVARSWEHPVETSEVNALAVAGLLEAADRLRRDGQDVRFVQASSAEIFGLAEHSPQDEHTAIRPANPYGASKAYAHHLVDVYRHRGLHASATILYGHESVRRPATFVTRKITSTVAAIVAGTADALVLGALDVYRDWGWAPEYVEAMMLAARHDEPGDYVIATGRSHSIAEFVEAAFTHAGIQDYQRYVTSDEAFRRPTDAAAQCGDPTRAGQILGWRPQVVFPEVAYRMVEADLAAAGVSRP
ncbi:MAG: GDP-mannose 4,6-dehydratase [Actinomycetales bacterium]